MLTGALPVKAVYAPLPPAPAVLLKVLAENGIGPDIALNKDEEEQENMEVNGENNEENKKKK